ncbi:MAG TPA: outer membrane protein [Pseudolabrys sp.]|nr:outer membrane protein [Pseudolabrys sp.]
MKRQFLTTVSILALAGTASAADLPRAMPMKAPAPPVVSWDWTGFYLGVNGGLLWHKGSYDIVDTVPEELTGSATKAGGTVGGQIGYNWQLQNYVVGVEGDLNWVGASATLNGSAFATSTFTSKLTWLSTIRGRGGILIDPRTLLFVTGGVAFGGVENDTNISGGSSDHSTRTGWTAGGGAEYKITDHWSAKAEALYVDLGKKTVPGFFGPGYAGTFKSTEIISRLGVNYKW